MPRKDDENVYTLPTKQKFDVLDTIPTACPRTSFVGYLSGTVSRRASSGEWICSLVVLPEYAEEINRLIVTNTQQVLMFTVEAWVPQPVKENGQ